MYSYTCGVLINMYKMVFLLYRIILYIKDVHNIVLTVLIARKYRII